MKNNRQLKREQAAAHNAAYTKEQERLSKMTPEEIRSEWITSSVRKTMTDLLPELKNSRGSKNQ